jgi:3-oxoacyl-(acyl-carrier-protein) synthase
MMPPIAIEAVAADTPLGDLEAVWEAWVGAAPVSPARVGPQADGWAERTAGVTEAVLRGMSAREREKCGLILATTKGDIAGEVAWLRAEGNVKGAMPTLGAEAGRLAHAAGLSGPAYAVSTACSSGLVALIEAALTVSEGAVERMIAVAGDESTSFVHDGFRSLKALSTTSCRPFDRRRDGLMLGAAAAAVRVARGDGPVVLSGFGISNDASHMTAPDPAAGGLIRAIEQALTMAKLSPDQIDVFFAHGTGTKYNDAMEAVAIEKVFLRNGARGPAVTAVKSLIGHTLGAAGLIEAALAVRMLKRQVIRPIVSLEVPEAAGIDFVMQTRRNVRVRHVLKTASGFGGMNAAVILSAGGA